jgi:hypothetical protein
MVSLDLGRSQKHVRVLRTELHNSSEWAIHVVEKPLPFGLRLPCADLSNIVRRGRVFAQTLIR